MPAFNLSLTVIVAQGLAQALLHSLWQSGAIAFFTWALLKLIPARHPGLRYWLSLGSLVCMLLAFFVTWHVLGRQTSIPDQPVQTPSITLQSRSTSQPQPKTQPSPSPTFTDINTNSSTASSSPVSISASPASIPSAPAAPPPLTRITHSLLPWFSGLWLIGVAVMLSRLFLAVIRGFVIRRSASPITFGHERDLFDQLSAQFASPWLPFTHARLAVSSRVQVPSVVGWLWPLVLLPAHGLSALSPEELKLVLAHELAHTRRMDALVNLLQCLTESFLFFNPAIWWVNRVIRQEREACCDAIALSLTRATPDAYIGALYNWGRMTTAVGEPHLAFTGPPRHKLLDRVNRLVTPHAPPELSSPAGSLLLIAGIVLTLFIGTASNHVSGKPAAYIPDPANPPVTLTYKIQDLTDTSWRMRFTPDQVVEHITSTVATPDFWSTIDTGHTPGVITRRFNVHLIVTAPTQTHPFVQTALSKLRWRQTQAQAPLPSPSRGGLDIDLIPPMSSGSPAPIAHTFTPQQETAAFAQIARLQSRYGDPQPNLKPIPAKVQVRLIMPDGIPIPPQSQVFLGCRAGNLWGPSQAQSPSADGFCTFEIPPSNFGVTAHVPGYHTDWQGPFWAVAGAQYPLISLTLKPNSLRKVQFVDKNNQAINPGKIHLDYLATAFRNGPMRHIGGRYFPGPSLPVTGSSIDLLLPPPGNIFTVCPETPGLDFTNVSVTIPPGSDPITVTLSPSPQATGLIVDANTSLPIENAAIAPRDNLSSYPFHTPTPIHTDAAGRFTYGTFTSTPYRSSQAGLEPFEPGPYPLWVSAPGYASLPIFVERSFSTHVPTQLKLLRQQPHQLHITGDLTRLPGYPHSPYVILQRITLSGPSQPQSSTSLQFPVTVQSGSATAIITGCSDLTTTDIYLPGLMALYTTVGPASPAPIKWHIPKATATRPVKIHIPGHSPQALNNARFEVIFSTPADPGEPVMHAKRNVLPLTFDSTSTATVDLPLLTTAGVTCAGLDPDIWDKTFPVPEGDGPLLISRYFPTLPAKGAIFLRIVDAQSNPLPECQVCISDSGPWSRIRRILQNTANGVAFGDLPIWPKTSFNITLQFPLRPDKNFDLPAITLTPDAPVQEVLIRLSPDKLSATLTVIKQAP